MAILEMAREKAVKAIERYKNNKNILKTYCDVGIEIYRRSHDSSVFEESMRNLKAAETRLGDPEITTSIIVFERQFSKYQSELAEEL